MTPDELKKRTKQFGLNIIRLVETLPRSQTVFVISSQLLRSAMSVGANYRAACRAKSKADFISKLAIVEEEADESFYWLEMLIEAKAVSNAALSKLLAEANELTAIISASRKTARASLRQSH